MERTMSIKKNFFALSASGLGATRRAAMLLLATLLLTTMTVWAQTTSTITVGSTDYTLFTGFTATSGNGTNYAKLVDGNTSTDWIATKNYDDPNAPANDFAGGTADPAFVEFHADEPFIPKGYVLTCDHENAGFWKPVEWALKAKLNESDAWTTIQSSTTTLGQGKTFEIACDNDGNNEYQYFRFEVYEVGTTMTVDLDELQFYGLLPTYTHLTVKAATCMATGIKVDCYRRNSDGKYFTDNTGTTELQESDVIAPIIPHTGEHHEATDVNIEYWQCSMCGKYFSDSGYTTEITEEQTKIYRTITIDGSISGLVTVAFSKTQALAGETVYLYISDLIDASTLKVNDGAVELTAKTDIQYTFTMPAADVTVTADVAQSNADGDVLTGSIRHTVTIPDGASITLNNATITGSIVCEGSATITLVGTNSVSGANNKAGIQIGGSGTTLTIKGDGSLTANGGSQSAGIGLSRAWNVTEDVVGGNIVINGGNITANGGGGGAGIGAGVTKDPNNSSSRKAIVGTITIAGGSVTAVGGSNADGIGAGENNYNATIQIGTVTICDGIDKVDASSIKDFASVVYMHGETNVTASKTDYFVIGEDGSRRLIVQKPVIAEIAEQAYTGSAITPKPQVTIGSLSLTQGTDYTYSYSNNTNVGTATVRATFQGDYASLGSVEKEFIIAPKAVTNEDITVTIPSQTWTGSAIEPDVTVKDGETTLTLGTDYEVAYSNNVNAGTATVTITGKGNYSDSKEATFTIEGKQTTIKDVEGHDVSSVENAYTITEDQNGVTLTLIVPDETTTPPSVDIPVAVEVDHVVIDRLFASGKAATVYLPFSIEVSKIGGGTFHTFLNVDETTTPQWTVTYSPPLADDATLQAGTPYIFMPNGSYGGKIVVNNGNEKISICTANPHTTTQGLWEFIGTYEPIVWLSNPADVGYNAQRAAEIGYVYGFASEDRTFGGKDYTVGQFVKVGSGASIDPNRAYLKRNVDQQAPALGGSGRTAVELPSAMRVVILSANSTTGIVEMRNENEEMRNDTWHTLGGRRLQGKPSGRGMYIHNGRKEVIR